MGWANCGTDSKGRPIGYAHEGTCDASGCNAPIDRGLAYACGEMHGEGHIDTDSTPVTCEGYFCTAHQEIVEVLYRRHKHDGDTVMLIVCPECCAAAPTCAECGISSWALRSDGYCVPCSNRRKG